MQILLEYGLDPTFIDEVLNSKKYHKIITNHYIDYKDPNNAELLRQLYEEAKVPNYKIAMLCNTSEATCRKYLDKYGVNNRGHFCGQNSDCKYFQTIDTPDKAYFLGFIFADGSIVDETTATRNRKVLSLTITEGDGYLLQTFLRYSGIVSTIYTTHAKDEKPRVQINIHATKICEDLISHGCVPRKSLAQTEFTISGIPEALMPHFIRGYFDGDGIGFSDGKLGFCGHYTILSFIYEYLKTHIQLLSYPQITYNESNHIYYLVFGTQNAALIARCLYEDKRDLYLTRKYDIYRLVL